MFHILEKFSPASASRKCILHLCAKILTLYYRKPKMQQKIFTNIFICCLLNITYQIILTKMLYCSYNLPSFQIVLNCLTIKCYLSVFQSVFTQFTGGIRDFDTIPRKIIKLSDNSVNCRNILKILKIRFF